VARSQLHGTRGALVPGVRARLRVVSRLLPPPLLRMLATGRRRWRHAQQGDVAGMPETAPWCQPQLQLDARETHEGAQK
jgi:hypothetical protein